MTTPSEFDGLLLDGEQPVVSYRAAGDTFSTYIGTGWIGLTDKRIILEAKTLMSGETSKTSIPYSQVASVSMTIDRRDVVRGTVKSIVRKTGRLLIETRGGTGFAVELRNAPDALRYLHDYILWKTLQ